MKLFPAVALIQREFNSRRDTRRELHYPTTNYSFINGTIHGLLISSRRDVLKHRFLIRHDSRLSTLRDFLLSSFNRFDATTNPIASHSIYR